MKLGFTTLLTLLFITLKLTSVITWSWWWVLAPLWASVALFVGLAVTAVIFLGALDWDTNRKLSRFK